MNADGTEPKRLAPGGSPRWSQDGASIYYYSPVEQAVCSLSLAHPDAQPKRIMACSHAWASVSPDGQRVAYFEEETLKVQDLASQSLVARCAMPSVTWVITAWSPTGQEVCLGICNWYKPGLWVYNLDKGELACVIPGPIWHGAWSPDRTKLAFCLGRPHFEIWVADLDPKVSTIEALSPTQTLDEHFQEMEALYMRRLEADPTDAANYLSRAEEYRRLHEEAKTHGDFKP